MKTYRARDNEIVDEAGNQIVVILRTHCSAKTAALIAAAGALALNQQEQVKAGVVTSTFRKEATE